MSRKLKELMGREFATRYCELNGALLIDVSGLSGNDANAFRGRLRRQGVEVHVVQNRLTRRALADTPLAPIGKELHGPCAVVTAEASMIDVAKELVELVKEYPALVLKGGMLDGEPDYLAVEDLAKMRSRLELIGDIAAATLSPGRKLAGCLIGAGGRIAGCLKSMVDTLERGETIKKVA
ncbi:MAG: 50S ribosomal protein L10 [Phycisphaerae bacterium]